MNQRGVGRFMELPVLLRQPMEAYLLIISLSLLILLVLMALNYSEQVSAETLVAPPENFTIQEVETTTRYIVGNWTISGETVVIQDETVEIWGNLSINDSGFLILVNSTLIVNSSLTGYWINVGSDGRLETYDSTISGISAVDGLTILVQNDTILERTIIRRVCSSGDQGGIRLLDGRIEIRNSTFEYCSSIYIFEVRTDIIFFNVTTRWCSGTYLLLQYNHPEVRRNLTWWVKDCHFIIYDWVYRHHGIEIRPYSYTGYSVRAIIEGTTVEQFDEGMYIAISEGLDALIQDCIIVKNRYGISLYQKIGGTVRLKANRIGLCEYVASCGINMRVYQTSSIIFEDTVVLGTATFRME
jgi:hypothetical protein